MSKNKKTGLIIASISLIIISIFCAITAIGLVNWLQNEGGPINFVTNDTVKATAQETLTIEPQDLTELIFDLGFSDIEISESENDLITLELYKTTWAATKEEAEETVNTLTLEQDQRGSKLTFSSPRKPEKNLITLQNRTDTIDIKLSIPKDMIISVKVDLGQVIIFDYKGKLSIENKFGSTSVDNLNGTLNIDGNNGKITLNNVTTDQPLSISTDFGDAFITNLKTAGFEFVSQNGKITLQDITSTGECSLNADFTNIEIDNIECSTLTIESKNGPININKGLISGPLKISTDFGKLDIKNVTAESYSFTTLNGDVYANALQGKVDVECDFGNLDLYGQDEITLQIDSQNGDVIFQGELDPDASHTILSDFGKIDIRIPEDSAFDIDISTDFGEIETDFPITLTGKISNSEMEGQINGGGPLLTIESQNGDIILNYLEN